VGTSKVVDESNDDGVDWGSIWRELNRQIYLGDDNFVARMQGSGAAMPLVTGVPKVQKCHPAPPIEELLSEVTDRNQGILAVYNTGGYSYQQIAQYFGCITPRWAGLSGKYGIGGEGCGVHQF
jgi:hypothetical protein